MVEKIIIEKKRRSVLCRKKDMEPLIGRGDWSQEIGAGWRRNGNGIYIRLNPNSLLPRLNDFIKRNVERRFPKKGFYAGVIENEYAMLQNGEAPDFVIFEAEFTRK